MVAIDNATPLIGLDAVVLHTETTGSDPAKARVVEVGILRLARGRLDLDKQQRCLVHPGEPIPLAASQIHGVDDVAVCDAPAFAAVAPKISAAINGSVVVGHSLAFDLEALRAEFSRARMAWSPPRALDTRLLAQIAAPSLNGYSLDNLAAWLGVAVTKRHSALGDAETAARIFLALLPKLRAVGIRTLAEAERACRSLGGAPGDGRRLGSVRGSDAVGDKARLAAVRIDTYPYRQRVGEIMRSPVVFIAPDATIASAIDRMSRERVSSVYIHPDGSGRPARPTEIGIVTERDLLRAIAENGPKVLSKPASKLANRPLAAVPADAFCYIAAERMCRLGVRHLGATDATGFVVGALSDRDLWRERSRDAPSLGGDLEAGSSAPELACAWSRLPQLAAALIGAEMSGRQIAAVISRELRGLTARAATLAEERMRDSGNGGPPCPYALAVLGSAGRGESLLAVEQDNALVFAEGAPDGPENAWFKQFGSHVADFLHEVAVPYCKAGVMAKTASWRGSVATWRARIGDWMQRSVPSKLRSVDNFFDMLGVHGDTALTETIWQEGFNAANGEAGFAKLLIDSSGAVEPGFTLFGRLKTDHGRIDLKTHGLIGIVRSARALALCHHVVERSTPARLAGLRARGIGGAREFDALVEAQATFLDLLIAQQVDDAERGIPLSNAVQIGRLSQHDRERLRAALDALAPLDKLTRDLLFRV